VFDWAWAEAYHRNRLPYYPKALIAVPFTPVPGSRLLARDAQSRALLVQALIAETDRLGVSGLHVLFPESDDASALEAAGMMRRQGVQFHWMNAGWPDFDAFLADLSQPKRKKIRAERRKVAEAGVRFAQAHQGAAARMAAAVLDHSSLRNTSLISNVSF
jgi:predicted N-acyltransferase